MVQLQASKIVPWYSLPLLAAPRSLIKSRYNQPRRLVPKRIPLRRSRVHPRQPMVLKWQMRSHLRYKESARQKPRRRRKALRRKKGAEVLALLNPIRTPPPIKKLSRQKPMVFQLMQLNSSLM